MSLHTYLAMSFLTFVVSVYTYVTNDSSDRIRAKISIAGTIISIVFAVTVVCVSIFGNAETNTEITPIYKVDGNYIKYTGRHNTTPNVYVKTYLNSYSLRSLSKFTPIISSEDSAYLKSISKTRSLGPLVITKTDYVIVLPNNDST